MRIFRDIMSAEDVTDITSMDEVLSDAFKMEDFKGGGTNGLVKVPVKMISWKTGIDDSAIGGNASAEGEDVDDLQDGVQTGLDVVVNHNLVKVPIFHEELNFSAFQKSYFKPFCKNLVSRLSLEQAAKFKKDAPTIMKYIKDNWKELEFYVGKSGEYDTCDPKALSEKHTLCFAEFGSSGYVDTMYYIECALVEEKV